MTYTFKNLLLLSAVVSFASFSSVAMAADEAEVVAADNKAKAVAVIINNAGAEIGTIDVTEGNDGVVLGVSLKGLPAGKHGFHIHNTGDCSDHDAFKMSGGHISEEGDMHGFFNEEGPEAGDLPNLIVPANGEVVVDFYAPDLEVSGYDETALLDENGSAFVIHAEPDDYTTQPIGGAGARIACGVIKAAE